ncbi:hypothetical protein DYD21_10995 [Rhodohalobacter sp. SW132]|uniref:hypothetical protein n=1 Tax=Rhodohalobacter sp. SW132 TaxID=2293433 RepID=UPI000E24A35F|nr:hypothetical protein [Rhodohalobacter sp. SW132]REL33300.1 hypothetical protein DYD21_10995 [Rhodohalobacter sp. SW132]
MQKNKFEQWIFESYSPGAEGLAIYRIFASLLFLFFLLPDFGLYSVLTSYPTDFFTPPPGPMMLFDDFPPEIFLQAVHILLILSWIGVLLGIYTKISSVTAGISMLILQGFMFSLGKINHELLLSVTPIIMAFSNWGAAFSFDSAKRRVSEKTEGWPLVLLALFIGFMMFTAGFPKILGGWLDPTTQATKGHLLNQYFMRGRQDLLADAAVQIDSAWIWEFLDWATILFEVGFLVAVLKAGWFRLFCCFAVMFHFSTMMTLNIAFLPNFLAYAAFFKWDDLADKLKNQSLSTKTKQNSARMALYFGGALFLFFFVLRWVSDRGLLISTTEPTLHEVVLISLFLLIVIFLGIKKLIKLLNSTGEV